MLTHCCALSNRPHMRAELEGRDTVAFKCLTFRFQDDDHFLQTWYWDGKKCHIRPENRSDDYDDIPDDGLGADVFQLERVPTGVSLEDIHAHGAT